MWTKGMAMFLSIVLMSTQVASELTDPNLQSIPPQSIRYTTDIAQVGTLTRDVSYESRLSFPNSITMNIPRTATFLSSVVHTGDYVEKGKLLASFTVEADQIAIAQAALEYEQIVWSYDRVKFDYQDAVTNARKKVESALSLKEKKLAEIEFNRAIEEEVFARTVAMRQADVAYERWETLQTQGEDFKLVAPISGVVSDIPYLREGALVTQGQYFCTMHSMDEFELVVSSGDLTSLKYGAQVTITTNYRDTPEFAGRVIANTAILGVNDLEKYAVVSFDSPKEVIELSQKWPATMNGAQFRVHISLADINNVLLVPRRAVQTESVKRYVTILENGLAKKRYVLTGLNNSEYVQIVEGIAPNSEIILN